jgi:uncharacterized membrane protein
LKAEPQYDGNDPYYRRWNMAHVEQETTISVPVAAVFRKLLEPETATEWLINLEEVRNLTGCEVGGTYEWTFNMAGRVPFKGKNIFTEIIPNQRVAYESAGGIKSAWDWRLTPTPDGATRVHVAVDYTVPGSVLGALADKLFIERQNETDLRESLANLKEVLEEDQASERAISG